MAAQLVSIDPKYSGKMRIEGYLKKAKRLGAVGRVFGRFNLRYFVLDLQSGTFYYCKKQGASSAMKPHAICDITEFDRNPDIQKDTCDWRYAFVVWFDKKRYKLYAESVKKQWEWIQAFQSIRNQYLAPSAPEVRDDNQNIQSDNQNQEQIKKEEPEISRAQRFFEIPATPSPPIQTPVPQTPPPKTPPPWETAKTDDQQDTVTPVKDLFITVNNFAEADKALSTKDDTPKAPQEDPWNQMNSVKQRRHPQTTKNETVKFEREIVSEVRIPRAPGVNTVPKGPRTSSLFVRNRRYNSGGSSPVKNRSNQKAEPSPPSIQNEPIETKIEQNVTLNFVDEFKEQKGSIKDTLFDLEECIQNVQPLITKTVEEPKTIIRPEQPNSNRGSPRKPPRWRTSGSPRKFVVSEQSPMTLYTIPSPPKPQEKYAEVTAVPTAEKQKSGYQERPVDLKAYTSMPTSPKSQYWWDDEEGEEPQAEVRSPLVPQRQLNAPAEVINPFLAPSEPPRARHPSAPPAARMESSFSSDAPQLQYEEVAIPAAPKKQMSVQKQVLQPSMPSQPSAQFDFDADVPQMRQQQFSRPVQPKQPSPAPPQARHSSMPATPRAYFSRPSTAKYSEVTISQSDTVQDSVNTSNPLAATQVLKVNYDWDDWDEEDY